MKFFKLLLTIIGFMFLRMNILKAENFYISVRIPDLPAGATAQVVITAPTEFTVLGTTTPVKNYTIKYVIPRKQIINGYELPVSSSILSGIISGDWK